MTIIVGSNHVRKSASWGVLALIFAWCLHPALSTSEDPNDDADDFDEGALLGISTVFVMNIVGVLTVALLIVFRYSDNRNNSVASVSLITVGALSASGLLALFPIDVGQAFGVSQGDVDPDALGPIFRKMYRVCYWMSMVITYAALPSMELVIRSGAYGLKARIIDAMTQIIKLLVGIIVIAVLVTVIFVAVENDW
jgi:hypothetical protein